MTEINYAKKIREAIKDFKAGKIDGKELKAVADTNANAADSADDAAAYAAYAADSVAAAADAADDEAVDAYADAYAIADTTEVMKAN